MDDFRILKAEDEKILLNRIALTRQASHFGHKGCKKWASGFGIQVPLSGYARCKTLHEATVGCDRFYRFRINQVSSPRIFVKMTGIQPGKIKEK